MEICVAYLWNARLNICKITNWSQQPLFKNKKWEAGSRRMYGPAKDLEYSMPSNLLFSLFSCLPIHCFNFNNDDFSCLGVIFFSLCQFITNSLLFLAHLLVISVFMCSNILQMVNLCSSVYVLTREGHMGVHLSFVLSADSHSFTHVFPGVFGDFWMWLLQGGLSLREPWGHQENNDVLQRRQCCLWQGPCDPGNVCPHLSRDRAVSGAPGSTSHPCGCPGGPPLPGTTATALFWPGFLIPSLAIPMTSWVLKRKRKVNVSVGSDHLNLPIIKLSLCWGVFFTTQRFVTDRVLWTHLLPPAGRLWPVCSITLCHTCPQVSHVPVSQNVTWN